MLIVNDITRTFEIVLDTEEYSHNMAVFLLVEILTDSKIRSFLTPEELILIEIVSNIDYAVLTEEFKYKTKVLHRFVMSLIKSKPSYGYSWSPVQ